MRVIFQTFLLCFLCKWSNQQASDELPQMIGVRVENEEAALDYGEDKMITKVKINEEAVLRLFGSNMHLVHTVRLTPEMYKCTVNVSGLITPGHVMDHNPDQLSVKATFPIAGRRYYFCFEPRRQTDEHHVPPESLPNDGFLFQGKEHTTIIEADEEESEAFAPVWVIVILILFLLVLAALFSGLNIGLMALDLTELNVILKSGSKTEKKYAKKIVPIRSKGNYLLCTILLGIAVIQSAVSILFEKITNGYIAIIASSLGIVIFGEIIPQSICTRWGLVVGARTVVIMKFFMFLTSPLSWPTSKLLDKIFGKDVGRTYSRQRLLQLIKLSRESHRDLEHCHEVAIVSGALLMGEKKVREIMTKEHSIFMVPVESVLDLTTISTIVNSGKTRIPVYEGDRTNVIDVLNVKDLALVDPEDRMKLKMLLDCNKRPLRFVSDDTPIRTLLDEFKSGQYHIAFVEPSAETASKANGGTAEMPKRSDNENKREVIGLVTLEDIIEEIIQAEIMDESDLAEQLKEVMRRLSFGRGRRTLAAVAEDEKSIGGGDHIMPKHSLLATEQFLSAQFKIFTPEFMSPKVLRQLIKQNVAEIKVSGTTNRALLMGIKDNANNNANNTSTTDFLYMRNKPANYFILILEGVVQVTAGEEGFVFEVGSFRHFGRSVLEEAWAKIQENNKLHKASLEAEFASIDFVPDFTARPLTNIVYLKISTLDYWHAFYVSVLEMNEKQKQSTELSSNSSASTMTDQTTPGGSLVKRSLSSSNSKNSLSDGLVLRISQSGANLTPVREEAERRDHL